MALMILLEAEDPQGNKAKIEVTEFKTLQDAAKIISDLCIRIELLEKEIKKLKNGTDT